MWFEPLGPVTVENVDRNGRGFRLSRGDSRILRGGSLSQFKGRLGGWVTFAALGVPKGGHFRSFRSFRAKISPRAFARFRDGGEVQHAAVLPGHAGNVLARTYARAGTCTCAS